MQGQVFLKGKGRDWHFCNLIFQVLLFLNLEIILLYARLRYAFDEKLFFSGYIICHSNLSKNEAVCMCKEGWCVGLGREGGGNCMKYLKRRWNRTEARGNKNFKNVFKLG